MPTTPRMELDKLRPLTKTGPGRSIIDSPGVAELRLALSKAIAFAELGLDLLEIRSDPRTTKELVKAIFVGTAHTQVQRNAAVELCRRLDEAERQLLESQHRENDRDGEMSVSAKMSRAIRQVVELYGAKLADIPTSQLREMQTIAAAFALDMQDELGRRDD